MPGRGPQGLDVVVSVNLSSASLREDLNPHRQESSGKTLGRTVVGFVNLSIESLREERKPHNQECSGQTSLELRHDTGRR